MGIYKVLLIQEFCLLYVKYRFPSQIDFNKCREEIKRSLQDLCNRWCKREHVESYALKTWKINILVLLIVEFNFIAII